MGIKFLPNKVYEVSHCQRHPISRKPGNLRRTTNYQGEQITTLAEARRVYAQLVIKLNDKMKDDVVPTWKEIVRRYCEAALSERGLTQKTVENYRLGLEAHTFLSWGHRKVDSIETREIRALIIERLANRSPSQQKNVLKFIRAVFTFAVEQGAVPRNPVPEMKFRMCDKIKGVLTEKQIEILLNKAKELDCEWYYHWCVAVYTGMRSGELYALTWDKVNLEQRQMKVDCSWNNVDKFKSTKSGDDRIVEIAPPLVPVLAELKLRYPESHFVLPRLDKWDKGEQARELRMFLMGLGLPPMRFHDLRASWATLMLSRGIQPIKVMYMGGWKDLKTMMIYMRKAGVEIKGITDSLNLHNPSREPARVISISSRTEV